MKNLEVTDDVDTVYLLCWQCLHLMFRLSTLKLEVRALVLCNNRSFDIGFIFVAAAVEKLSVVFCVGKE